MRTPQKKVVITYPKVRNNPKSIAQHKEFCFYQLIKYSPWTVDNFAEISDMDTAIQRYDNFYANTTDSIRASLKFTKDLSARLREVRNELQDPEVADLAVADEWMKLSSAMPQLIDKYNNLTNSNYEWSKSRENYSDEELYKMINWIDAQKTLANEAEMDEENVIFDADPNKLNKLQRFTYNLIEKFKLDKKQLLMILLGTAGTGKSYTVAAVTKLYLGLLKKACPTAKAAFLINGKLNKSLIKLYQVLFINICDKLYYYFCAYSE